MVNVSIIIPLYNDCAYWNRLINSLKEQSYKSFEVIFVDDGSNDKTGTWADEYCKNAENYICVHQKNQGQSVARKTGIKYAKGKFLTFIDGDDWVSPTYLQELVKLVSNDSVDLGISNYFLASENNIQVRKREKEKTKYLSYNEFITKWILGYEFKGFLPTKIFKTNLIKKCMDMHEKNNYLEDVRLVTRYLTFVHVVGYSNKPTYYYYQRDSSSVHRMSTDNDWKGFHLTMKVLKSKIATRDGEIAFLVRYFMEGTAIISRMNEKDLKKNTNYTNYINYINNISKKRFLLKKMKTIDNLILIAISCGLSPLLLIKLKKHLIKIKYWKINNTFKNTEI